MTGEPHSPGAREWRPRGSVIRFRDFGDRGFPWRPAIAAALAPLVTGACLARVIVRYDGWLLWIAFGAAMVFAVSMTRFVDRFQRPERLLEIDSARRKFLAWSGAPLRDLRRSGGHRVVFLFEEVSSLTLVSRRWRVNHERRGVTRSTTEHQRHALLAMPAGVVVFESANYGKVARAGTVLAQRLRIFFVSLGPSRPSTDVLWAPEGQGRARGHAPEAEDTPSLDPAHPLNGRV